MSATSKSIEVTFSNNELKQTKPIVPRLWSSQILDGAILNCKTSRRFLGLLQALV